MSTNFELTSVLNNLIGNSKGDIVKDNRVDWDKLHNQQSLIIEETLETKEAFEDKDIVEYVDGLVDILVVTYGALHRLGLDANEIFKEVNNSNMSKFCITLKDAQINLQEFTDKDVPCKIIRVDDYYCLVTTVACKLDGKKIPEGKLLKPNTYIKPNITKFVKHLISNE